MYHSKSCAVSYSSSIVTMAVSCIISDSETLVENRDFFILPCIQRPRYRVSANIAMTFGAATTRTVNLPDCGYTLKLCDRIPACDGLTDRQTDILRQHGLRYAWHHAVKSTVHTYPV